MTFTITPDDGSTPWFWSRSPDFGEQMADSLGQIAAPTDGTRTFVQTLAIRTRTWSFGFSGLNTDEAAGFEDYFLTILRGAAEPFSLTWTDNANLVSYSDRFEASDTDWTAIGTAPPTVTDEAATNQAGYANRVTTVAFGVTNSVLRLDPLPLATLTDQVYVGVRAANQAASDVTLQVDAGGTAEFTRTLPTGGAFVEVHGVLDMTLGSSSGPYLDLSLDPAVAETIHLERVWASIGRHRAYRRNPQATISNARIIPSSLERVERQHDVWDLSFTVYEEVG